MAKKIALGRGLGSLIRGGVSSPAKEKEKGRKAGKSGSGKRSKADAAEADGQPDIPSGTILLPRKQLPVAAAGKPAKTAKPAPAAEADAAGLVPQQAAATPEQPAAPDPVTGLAEIPLAQVLANPHQPRKEFADESLHELAESIRAEGLLQPIVVRRDPEGHFILIAGERRLRACQMLKLKVIPARIIEASEVSSAVLSLIENLQRENLNPIEEAHGYASLLRDFNLTQEQVAERVGRGRASVANMLRLLQLPREIQGFLGKGHLSTGHAKVLLGVEDANLQLLLARHVIEQSWSVRELERQVERARQSREPARPARIAPPAEQAALQDLQNQLATALGTPVTLRHSPRKGRIVIEYFGNDDLQRILNRMGIC